MRVDGRAVADDLFVSLAASRAHAPRDVRLGILVVGDDPVVGSFVRIKERAAARLNVSMVRRDLPADATTGDAVRAVQELSRAADAVIVQLPLPRQMDTDAVLAAIPAGQDVDAIRPGLSDEERTVYAPVALAVEEILARGGVDPAGKRAVVIGAGRLVGAPTAALLKRRGAHVSVFTLQKGSIEDLKDADIVVCGAGNPGFVRPEHIKEGVALVDAGASESNGEVVGDADPACEEKAALFTPVPGGVGPVAVAMIFRNLLDLVDKKR